MKLYFVCLYVVLALLALVVFFGVLNLRARASFTLSSISNDDKDSVRAGFNEKRLLLLFVFID